MKEDINIIYIDDRPDIMLSEYLKATFKGRYKEIVFNSSTEFETLFNIIRHEIRSVILIDSKLFENSNAGNKFTGEEFMMVIKEQLPFIEIIIITQNDDYCEDIGAILKYRLSDIEEPNHYYATKLFPAIEISIKKIIAYEYISNKMTGNSPVFDAYIIEKIKNSINGISDYNSLNVGDIDRLIEAFKEFKEDNGL